MMHYYLQKGFDIYKLLSLSFSEKMFYYASMHTALEESKINWGE